MSTVKPIELNPIERFYRAHADAVYAFLLSLCRDPIWAEDLMQDTFVKAVRFEAQFKPGTHLKAWLHTILHNTFLNERRRAVHDPGRRAGADRVGHVVSRAAGAVR